MEIWVLRWEIWVPGRGIWFPGMEIWVLGRQVCSRQEDLRSRAAQSRTDLTPISEMFNVQIDQGFLSEEFRESTSGKILWSN